MTDLTTYETPGLICPFCGTEHDRSATVMGSGPKEDDVSICMVCSGISVFTDEIKLRKPTAKELKLIERSATTQHMLNAVRETKKQGVDQ